MSDAKRPGRRPRRGSPMPRTGFTAFPEQIIFYLLLSGHQRAVSAGVQIAPSILASVSPEHQEMLNKAKWITSKARQELEAQAENDEAEITHDDVLRFTLDHRDRLEANYEDRSETA